MGDLRRYGTYIANGLVLHKILQMLESVGLLIEPYYFYQEDAVYHADLIRGTRFDEYECSEVGPEEVEGIAALDPNSDSRPSVLNEFRLGRHCFALRHRGRIIAASWWDLREINFIPVRRPLEPHEAYIYRSETLFEYRGRNVAPYLRSRMYAMFLGEGRDVIYSFTGCFNTPAVRFKKKIGARILFVGLHVRIFGSIRKNWVLSRRSAVDRCRTAPPLVV